MGNIKDTFGSLLSYFNLRSRPLAGEEGKTVHGFSVTDISGSPLKLSSFKGDVILLVNTASYCGFTPQYGKLEELYHKYKDRGFKVIGFPCNDFGGQEPGSNEEILRFCTISYNVSFPMLSKAPAAGADAHPLFKFLTQEANSTLTGSIKWNFEKFLIDKKGQLRARFSSVVPPSAKNITRSIEQLLAT